jgi:hypothetical protein
VICSWVPASYFRVLVSCSWVLVSCSRVLVLRNAIARNNLACKIRYFIGNIPRDLKIFFLETHMMINFARDYKGATRIREDIIDREPHSGFAGEYRCQRKPF